MPMPHPRKGAKWKENKKRNSKMYTKAKRGSCGAAKVKDMNRKYKHNKLDSLVRRK